MLARAVWGEFLAHWAPTEDVQPPYLVVAVLSCTLGPGQPQLASPGLSRRVHTTSKCTLTVTWVLKSNGPSLPA
jgi:hypothetical protein